MITPEDYQIPAIEFVAKRRRALLQSPAGSGKTIMAALALWKVVTARQRTQKVRVGWIANTTEQTGQGWQAIRAVDGLENAIDAEIECPAGYSGREVDVLVVDECHHAPAETWRAIIDRHLDGGGALWMMSATPFSPDEADEPRNEYIRSLVFHHVHIIEKKDVQRRVVPGRVIMLNDTDDGLEELIAARIEEDMEYQHPRMVRFKGPELWAETALVFAARYFNEKQKIEMVSLGLPIPQAVAVMMGRSSAGRQQMEDWIDEKARGILYPRIANLACQQIGLLPNVARNQAVIDTARHHIAAGDSVLVLVWSVEHGQGLAAAIGIPMCNSKIGKKKRSKIIEGCKSGELRGMVATSLADEGMDVPIFNVLVMAGAGRKAAKTEQRAGRVLRAHGDKTEGTIYDFTDEHVHPMLHRQAKQRMATFRALGYPIQMPGQPQLV